MGERVPSHPYLCQERRLRDTYSEMPHKQGFLDAYEIFFNRGIERQDSDRSHYDRHQEYKIN